MHFGKMEFLVFGLTLWAASLYEITAAGEACNEYVDGILRDMKEDTEVFRDPYEIPTKTIEVHKQLLLINYTGEASIYDGHIYGLRTVNRDGDVVVDRMKQTHLKIFLGAGELQMKCSGKVKLMGHGPQAKVEAKISYVSMKLDVVPSAKDSNPKIQNFKVDDVKGSEVKVSGLGPLNFFMNAYIRIIGKFFRNIVLSAVEGRMKTFLNKKVNKYPIPEECLNDAFKRSAKYIGL
ncbi:uncharacterized protein LOC129218680 [Uloborus diversus]|uniref:uncharacterized protein LOC129218680 n=1 Tax=Uloborus diversus TaxID=327109 RepID=UPI002409B827|nr:uncharacterized protein LOC129218680 [Uloborus diversus]